MIIEKKGRPSQGGLPRFGCVPTEEVAYPWLFPAALMPLQSEFAAF
jgi:hypothetical protein